MSQTIATEKLPPSTVRSSRYAVDDLLGAGGFGEVFAILDKETNNRTFAVKRLLISDGVNNEEEESKPRYEYEIGRSLKHVNIIKHFDYEQNERYAFIWMEIADAGSLKERIAETIGSVSHRDAYSWFRQLADAVAYIHSQDIVHRDITPRNILFTQTGVLKLADYGLASRIDKDSSFECFVGCFNEYWCHSFEHNGPPGDLWYCGLSLLFIVTKKWWWSDVDKEDELHFAAKSRSFDHFHKFTDNFALLEIAKSILVLQPRDRPTMAAVVAALENLPRPV